MTCGIYKITNKENDKIYIGLSTNIEARWQEHLKKMNSTEQYDKILYRAFRKYGINNFTFEILEECLKEELNNKEKYWIDFFQSFNEYYGYNSTFGGESGTFNKLNPQTLSEIYLLLKENKLTNIEIGSIYNISDQMVSDINSGRSWYDPKYQYPIRKLFTKTQNFCIECGIEITNEKGVLRCIDCSHKAQRKVERPTPDTLIQEIKNSSMAAVGRKYGVSDNAIRKWLKAYGLPTSTKDIKNL